MNLMRLRELTSCAQHDRVVVVLEDVAQLRRLTFYAEAQEARRLAQQIQRGPRACHPVFDFIQALLRTWHATPVRVVLEDVEGEGIGALVYLRQGEIELSISCYPPDALTLALRSSVPIYATAEALAHAEEVAAADGLGGGEDVTGWLERVTPRDFET